jgi:hypothetical protein
VTEIDQNLTLFVSWKDLRQSYSDQSLINGPRKPRQLCQMRAEEKLQVGFGGYYLLVMDYIYFIFSDT